MERKLYLNRGGVSQEKPSYVKILLWAAAGLVVLMVLVPLLTGRKGTKNGFSKSGQDKGAVVREIPKSAGGMTDSGQQIPPLVTESKETADVKVAPLPGMQPLPDSLAKTSTTGSERAAEGIPGAKDQPAQVAASESAASQAFKALDGALPSPAVKTPPRGAAKPGAAQSVATAQTGVKPKDGTATAAATKPPDQATKTKPSGGELYTVQVGSYHEKKHADELLQNLKNKGYSGSIRTKPDPKGGQLYVVQLDPVSDMGKAHTLVAQVQHEEKVKPFVTKVQPGE